MVYSEVSDVTSERSSRLLDLLGLAPLRLSEPPPHSEGSTLINLTIFILYAPVTLWYGSCLGRRGSKGTLSIT